MLICAHLESAEGRHAVELVTNGARQSLAVAPKAEGFGSAVNGGELLCLALATCYCNDLYREAAKVGIAVARVAVDVTADFGAEGEAARSFRYRARVAARAPVPAIIALMLATDRVAEIQSTLRRGVPVHFEAPAADSIP